MMKTKPSLWLMILLMMFPQFVETIYSPALPHMSQEFNVNSQQASQTMSIYFIAFAIGVVFWGVMSDKIGRRKAMIYGLITYGIGAVVALLALNFETIMIARVIAAFGAAVGSVVTQTMLRDTFDKRELGEVFSVMGIALSISPVIGLLTGGIVAESYGYLGVFSILLVLAIVLVLITVTALPETKKESNIKPNFKVVLGELLRDKMIWNNAFLVAAFNIMLFSYYSLAPFIFEKSGYSSAEFGYSGIVLALGSFIGGVINKKLIRHFAPDYLVVLATLLTACGSLGVWLLQSSIWFLLPMLLTVAAYGIAIPNILSQALIRYKHAVGSAGALFGLIYYILIGLGLAISGLVQNLGLVLSVLALLSIVFAVRYRRLNCSKSI